MAEFDRRYREMRDIWGDYNRRQEFEHELINRKTTWLLTTQTIIFAAYGITLRGKSRPDGADEFREVVAWSGLLIALIMLFGVFFLMRSKWRSWKDYADVFSPFHRLKPPRPYDQGLQWGVSTKNTVLTLAPELCLPLVFIGAWSVLLI
jgi:hypothetical protein